jgi:hypothetical protein
MSNHITPVASTDITVYTSFQFSRLVPPRHSIHASVTRTCNSNRWFGSTQTLPCTPASWARVTCRHATENNNPISHYAPMSSSLILSLPLTHDLTSLLPPVSAMHHGIFTVQVNFRRPSWTVCYVPRELFGSVYPSQVDPSELLHLDPVNLPPDSVAPWAPTEPPSNSYQLPCMPQLNTIDSICSLPTSPQHRPEVWSANRYLSSFACCIFSSAFHDILSCLIALLTPARHTLPPWANLTDLACQSPRFFTEPKYSHRRLSPTSLDPPCFVTQRIALSYLM